MSRTPDPARVAIHSAQGGLLSIMAPETPSELEADELQPDDVVEVPIGDEMDLHPFQPREVKDVVESYLDAAYEKGFREVRIIHGRGIGVQ
ncbi:MAG: Smr/MutS family protein, partial [Holophagales bacterium]|nr:Smr/MutS family protein [Holophagales bacterium]